MAAHTPYDPAPSVAPSGAPGGDYQRIDTSSATFGGAVGAAQERTGAEAVQAGDRGIQAATQWQGFYNKVSADDAYNQYEDQVNKLLHGDPNDEKDQGYLGKLGADAMSGRKSVSQKIDDLRTQMRQKLSTDMARLEFDTNSRRLQQITNTTIGNHADRQMQVYAGATAKASFDRTIRSAANNPDDASYQADVEAATHEKVKEYQARYGLTLTPDQLSSAHDEGVAAVLTAKTVSRANTDPIGANSFFQKHADDLDGQTRATITAHLRPMLAQAGAAQIMRGGAPPVTASPQERDLMIRTIKGEAGGEGESGWAGVAHVFKNRLAAGTFGNSISDMILAPKQFSVWNKGDPAGKLARDLQPGSPEYEAIGRVVDQTMSGQRPDPTNGADHYYNPHAADPDWGDRLARRNDVTIGNHRFVGQIDKAKLTPPKDEAEAVQRGMAWAESVSRDPDLRISVMHAVKSLYSMQSQAGATQRDTLAQQAPILIKGLEEGRTDITFPRAQIEASMMGAPPAYQVKAREWLREADVAEKGGQAIAGDRWNPTEKWIETGRDLESGQGVISELIKGHKGASTGPGTLGAKPEDSDPTMSPRLRTSLAGIWQRAFESRQRALVGPQGDGEKNDPVAYVSDAPNVKEAAAAVRNGDPASFENFARVMKSTQTFLGVPEGATHILSRQTALEMTRKLTAAGDPKTVMDGLKKEYGGAWGDVFNDLVSMGKLPQGYQAVHAMEDPGEAHLLARAINDEKPGVDGKPQRSWADDIRGADGSNIAPKIKQRILASPAIATFEHSLLDSGMSGHDAREIINSTVTLGYAHAYYKGESTEAAADKAVEAFTGHYSFAAPGGARIPTPFVHNVTANMHAMLNNLSVDKITPPANFGTQFHATPDAYVRIVQSAPKWVTNRDETGVWLMDNQGGFVRDTAGKRLEIKFTDAAPTTVTLKDAQERAGYFHATGGGLFSKRPGTP